MEENNNCTQFYSWIKDRQKSKKSVWKRENKGEEEDEEEDEEELAAATAKESVEENE